jgi:hypothetical protein
LVDPTPEELSTLQKSVEDAVTLLLKGFFFNAALATYVDAYEVEMVNRFCSRRVVDAQ